MTAEGSIEAVEWLRNRQVVGEHKASPTQGGATRHRPPRRRSSTWRCGSVVVERVVASARQGKTWPGFVGVAAL